MNTRFSLLIQGGIPPNPEKLKMALPVKNIHRVTQFHQKNRQGYKIYWLYIFTYILKSKGIWNYLKEFDSKANRCNSTNVYIDCVWDNEKGKRLNFYIQAFLLSGVWCYYENWIIKSGSSLNSFFNWIFNLTILHEIVRTMIRIKIYIHYVNQLLPQHIHFNRICCSSFPFDLSLNWNEKLKK